MHISKLKFLDLEVSTFDTIIDVRSPTEFNDDHIPHAINLPVLSDEERALVGTTYKKDSRFKARKIGASLIAKNTADHLNNTLYSKNREWKPLIYCWRGGQRSSAFATILSQIGWRPSLVEGGYKNYRRAVTQLLHRSNTNFDLILLSGHTGTGKTEVLQALAALGLQTINLEELAAHRGSVFGALDRPQPKQKLFESSVYETITSLDTSQPIFLEAESRKIGNLVIPNMLWDQMKVARRIELAAPLTERAIYLTRAYQDLTADDEKLNRRINYLVTQQGHRKVEYWKNLSTKKEFVELAVELIESHYDPRYSNSRKSSKHDIIEFINLKTITKVEVAAAAQKIKKLFK